uniref:Mediator of RNA polymerase II transcription subunit 15a-like n=1 Tax=Populus alba TaxID=43335 RepID=A0A4U5PLZ1_POPAL|nr:mediator of RNA polymerase II transcription subunit 15a-like [Populus alba]
MQASSDPEFLNRLRNIAVQFEDKTFRNSATQGSYAYTIGKKMGSFGTIKSEASQTTGKNPSGLSQTSVVNDVGQSSETNAIAQFSQYLVEQNMQPNMSPDFQSEVPGSQSSDEKLMYQLQQQEFQDQILKDKVQSISNRFAIQPDIHNRQPHQRQKHVTSQTTQNLYSQPPSASPQYQQSSFALPSNSTMFQQNQQLRQQHDASEQRQWWMPQQNVLPSFQQPLGQQRDVSEIQHQQKLAGPQSIILNSQLHQSSSHMIQQQGVTASEQKVQKITQPVQSHQILGSQKQSGLSQEEIQPRPQTSASFHQERSITDQQKLFQSHRSFAGSSSASAEPKSSNQLANTADGHDADYQKLQDFKQQYKPQMEYLYKNLKSLLDKETDPDQAMKYMKQVIWIEKNMLVFSLQRNQMANASKEKLQMAQQAIIKFVNYFRKKSTASVEQQADPCLQNSGQSQISQPPLNWNEKLQLHPVNLTMTNGLGSSSLTSSMQSRFLNSRPGFFSSLQYSSGMGLEQRNGPSMLQQSARKTGINFSAAPQHTNLSSTNIVNAFDSPFAHQTTLTQNLEQQMQKQNIQHKKEQMLIRNSQKSGSPAMESPENLHQPLISTTIHQPYSSSPRKSQLSSARMDQQTFPLASPASTPLTSTSEYVAFNQVDSQTQSHNQSTASGTPGISASPLLEEYTSSPNTSDTNQPLQRLLQAVKSLSPDVLSAAVHDIDSVVNVVDKIAGGSAERHSKGAIGEDLVSETIFHVQERNFALQRLSMKDKEMEHQSNAMASDTIGQPMDWISDFDSTATSRFNKLRTEPSNDLLNEIRHVNQRLVETTVDVDSTEDVYLPEASAGTIIKCSYKAVAVSGDFKSLSSSPMFPELTLRLLVPAEFPISSPIILDRLPSGLSEELEDLSEKTKLRFSVALRNLSEPMSLLEIARTWDACARAVLLEHVQPLGGECFSSRYGTWENCLTA